MFKFSDLIGKESDSPVVDRFYGTDLVNGLETLCEISIHEDGTNTLRVIQVNDD